jgi:hypothetical protein
MTVAVAVAEAAEAEGLSRVKFGDIVKPRARRDAATGVSPHSGMLKRSEIDRFCAFALLLIAITDDVSGPFHNGRSDYQPDTDQRGNECKVDGIERPVRDMRAGSELWIQRLETAYTRKKSRRGKQ